MNRIIVTALALITGFFTLVFSLIMALVTRSLGQVVLLKLEF